MTKKTREQIQSEALEAFKLVSAGTICLSTGTGKSKVAIDFIKETPEIQIILITSPRTNLKENWRKELMKWGITYRLCDESPTGYWFKNRPLHIMIENIQTCYKWEKQKFDLIIADEIHTMMTPEYSALFENNKCKWLMGLTATHDITSKNDKGYFYKKYAPIIYEYYRSAEHGLINKTRFVIVNHSLGDEKVFYTIRGKRYQSTEAEYYEYLTSKIKEGQRRMMAMGSDDWFTDASDWFWKGMGNKEQKFAAMLYLNSIKQRKDFLLNLVSTAKIAKKIKDGILRDISDSKVLVFSELTAQADKITKNTVHSNNHKDINQRLINEFDEGTIRDLGSCRSLTLGLNLKGATHAIMESYIGSATQSKQKKGRLDRLATDDVAEMYIIRVSGTQADNWFEEMTKGFDLSEAEYFDSQIFMNDEFDYKERAYTGAIGCTGNSY